MLGLFQLNPEENALVDNSRIYCNEGGLGRFVYLALFKTSRSFVVCDFFHEIYVQIGFFDSLLFSVGFRVCCDMYFFIY